MKIVHFIYKDQPVDFLPSGNDNVMVNATQMAKVFGREMKDFNKLESTKNFIDACLISDDSSLIGIKQRIDLMISKQNSGTWVHRILALKFAAWLDPMFEVWVFATIDKIILGEYREQKEATVAKIIAVHELEAKKKELTEKYPEFLDFLKLEGKISDAEKRRIKALKATTAQLRMDLFLESSL